ncbi:MAG: HU family DNA-binding protein [candidate division KSB1 bacterium]|nr:HU family DNA-binding protein [candidate division KSB1 bacterium]MDZ7275370.1 HU family DNA-binding protein [candidate division KSB1 bacterium]MDZ7286317.1 HU family DNA-binding protein [candidate division KSB1 bacterium]MDZ7296544.1 HU family DNA-binding protein [candidate division KSB1 bacterium]MDZ7308107.1 HU family DNA-binding protein [candidate division KSB1 bacterium]
MSAKVRYLKLAARGPYQRKRFRLQPDHTSPEFLREFVREATSLIEEGLARDGVVRIHEFGTFELQWIKERRGRNPRTGETIIIPGQNRVIFRPAQKLELLANQELAHLKPTLLPAAPAAPEAQPSSAKAPSLPLSSQIEQLLADLVPKSTPQPARLRFDFAESEALAVEPATGAILVGHVVEEVDTGEKRTAQVESANHNGLAVTMPEEMPLADAKTFDRAGDWEKQAGKAAEPFAGAGRPTSSAGGPRPHYSTLPGARTEPGRVRWDFSEARVSPTHERSLEYFTASPAAREAAAARSRPRRFLWLLGTLTTLLVLMLAVFVTPIGEKKETLHSNAETAANGKPPAASSNVAPVQPAPFFPGGTHRVVAGDNLWNISGHYYFDPFLWPNIYRVNTATVPHPDLLEPEQLLALPVLYGHPRKLSEEDRRNLAEGYFLVFNYYRTSADKHLAPFALWAAVKYDPTLLERYRDQITADELAFLDAHEPGRMAVR